MITAIAAVKCLLLTNKKLKNALQITGKNEEICVNSGFFKKIVLKSTLWQQKNEQLNKKLKEANMKYEVKWSVFLLFIVFKERQKKAKRKKWRMGQVCKCVQKALQVNGKWQFNRNER